MPPSLARAMGGVCELNLVLLLKPAFKRRIYIAWEVNVEMS